MENIFSFFSNLVSNKSRNFSWKLFILRVYQKSKENDILIQAMGMVYLTLLSIVPFLLFLFYIMTLFDFFERFDSIFDQVKTLILNNLAAGTGETILNFLETYIFNVDIEQLGAISFFSLVLLIVFMLARIEVTFNQIWDVEEHRDIFKRFVAFWTFITLGTFIITLFSSMTFVLIERYTGIWFSDAEVSQNGIFSWIMFSLNFFIFIIAYYLIPNTDVDPTAALFSGTISGILFILSKNIYSIYTQNVMTYSYEQQIYGSLSVFPFFLIWLYLVWLIVLIGAVISYVFQHRNMLYYKDVKKHSDQTIKNLTPTAVLINIYKEFLKEKRSDGTKFKDLTEKIKLPADEIKKAIKILKKENFIIETKEGYFFPATDISKLSIWDIYKADSIMSDIDINKIFADREMQEVYIYLNNNIEASLKKINIEKILKKN
ncbi:MAG: YihY/virulence factor BrkB family protein [bacterium]